MWCHYFEGLLLACTELEVLRAPAHLCLRSRPGRNVTTDGPGTWAMLLALLLQHFSTLVSNVFKLLKHKERHSEPDFLFGICSSSVCQTQTCAACCSYFFMQERLALLPLLLSISTTAVQIKKKEGEGFS